MAANQFRPPQHDEAIGDLASSRASCPVCKTPVSFWRFAMTVIPPGKALCKTCDSRLQLAGYQQRLYFMLGCDGIIVCLGMYAMVWVQFYFGLAIACLGVVAWLGFLNRIYREAARDDRIALA